MNGAIINYSLNKFCPFLIIGFLVFTKFSFLTWEPYVILGLIYFTEKFNFNVGYSLAMCEAHGIDLNEGRR